jgi:dihydrofolate synthase/folylpolyglutamate synthase
VTDARSDVLLQRMMSLHPKIIDLTLDRMHRLLAALDHPEQRLPPVIHIAGTNGKGSTQAMLRAGIESAGHTTHAYTSPHLARFHERIRLAGSLINEDHLSDILDTCVAANGPESITYFEITTCAAFLAFSRTSADYTLLEVGLGGRLDATNVIDAPLLTIITPVDLDHQSYLGNTLAKIAFEKAGILKRGVPCVVGPQHDESLEVIEARAVAVGAPLLVYGQHWHVAEDRGRMIYQDEAGLLDLPLPNLIGAHQVRNAGGAIAALRHLGFDAQICEAAITTAQWPARMQRLHHGPLIDIAPEAEIWLDGGHNPAAAAALVEALSRLPRRPTHIICGMLNTKDVAGFIAPIADISDSFRAVSIPDQAATLSDDETVAIARAIGVMATACPDVQTALSQIIATDPLARVVICGSLYLAGTVLRENG